MRSKTAPDPCFFIGSCKKELSSLPAKVKARFGHGLYLAQCGDEALYAKSLRGFGGRGVMELIDDLDGDTYRAIYTVRFQGAIYALHAFQKKSVKGIATPKKTMDLVAARLRAAETDYRMTKGRKDRKP